MDEIDDLFNEFQRELNIKLQKLKYNINYSYDNKLDVLLNELIKKDVVL